MAAKFGVFVDEDHSKLPTLYWLPKLHKMPYVYISQLIRFARMCYNVDVFNNRNLFLTAKLLKHLVIYIIKFEKHVLNSTTDTQS